MHAAFHVLYVPLLEHNVHERFARSAWFRVEAATLRCTARRVGNAMTSAICAGYARDLKDKNIKKEVEAFRVAVERGESPTLRELRPYTRTVGAEWFANLRMNPESLSDPSARPRPWRAVRRPDRRRNAVVLDRIALRLRHTCFSVQT